MEFFQYILNNYMQIVERLVEHIELTVVAVMIALLIGVPLGILISYFKKANKPVLGVANLVQAIPSMALLGFAIPFLGIGYKPAIVVVVLYSLLPIIKNTYIGLEGINPGTLEAARGIGLTNAQILFRVKLPLALPVIMAGVRVSAVTAVGLMTMAAFIGGGGLGYLVFAGLRTANNYQILAGAIPACLLALIVDFLGAVVENLVTPKSILPKDKRYSKKRRTFQKVLLSAVALLLVAVFSVSIFTGNKTYDKLITIGGKDYTEQVLLCNLVAEAIESNTDINVVRKEALGGTQVCFGAIQSGDIDMYIEYTGTAYGDTLNHPPESDMDKVYNTVKDELKEKYDIEVLDQMNFNNTWTLAVTQEIAKKYNLTSISDLRAVANQMTLAAGEEFLEREDGISGLENTYGMRFRDKKAVNGSLRYSALVNEECEVIDAFATEGLLKKYELVVLEDDKDFFLPYYAIPIVRADVYEEYPEILPVLSQLGQLLTEEVMIDLNYRIDELQEKPEQVAHDFLVQHGISQ